MNTHPAELIERNYRISCRNDQISCPQGSGLSGTLLWRVTTESGDYCLRRWPAATRAERLAWTHRVLKFANDRGFQRLALPLPTVSERTWFQEAGQLWELDHWITGAADSAETPSVERLRTAMPALAEFHLAVESFEPVLPAPPQSAAERLAMTLAWNPGRLNDLRQALSRDSRPVLADLGREIVENFTRAAPLVTGPLASLAEQPAPLMPCLRDVWREHVLFARNQLTGIIDYGAMRVDTPATDISRLVASYAEDDADAWLFALTAYGEVRALAPAEQRLIPILDRAAVLLSGMNWLQWLFLDGRTFQNERLVRERLELSARRLRRLVTGFASASWRAT